MCDLPLWKAFHNCKSYLACTLAHEACLRGITTRYLRATKLFPAPQMARGDGTCLDEIKRLACTQLLVIDDFGLVTLDTDDRLVLLEILDDRYNAAGAIIAAQTLSKPGMSSSVSRQSPMPSWIVLPIHHGYSI